MTTPLEINALTRMQPLEAAAYLAGHNTATLRYIARQLKARNNGERDAVIAGILKKLFPEGPGSPPAASAEQMKLF